MWVCYHTHIFYLERIMKSITVVFYSDSGHGWGKVSLKLIKELGIENEITPFSYMRGQYAYLEEDCDAGILFNTLRTAGYEVKYKEHSTNKTSKIRSYKDYNPNKVDWNTFTCL